MSRRKDTDRHFRAPLSIVIPGPRAELPTRVREATSTVESSTIQSPVVAPQTVRVPRIVVRTPEAVAKGERRRLRTGDRRPLRIRVSEVILGGQSTPRTPKEKH